MATPLYPNISKTGNKNGPFTLESYIICQDCGERVERGIANIADHHFKCTHQKTEDADFEIIDNRNCVFNVTLIENRMKELGYLEDIEAEIIQPKQIRNNV